MTMTGVAFGQDKTPNTQKEATTDTEKQAPVTTQKPKKEEPLDIDAFFKRGEEAAKKGSKCTKPADPVA